MRLVDELERGLSSEESYFRRQLLREDLARVRRLRELAQDVAERARFLAEGARLGWTRGDERTAELAPALEPLLAAVWDYEHGVTGEASEALLVRAWHALARERIERMIGCLSTPVAPPD